MNGQDSLLLRAFSTQFKELCADLERVFPEDVDIRAATKMLTQLCATNPRLLLVVFRDYIGVPYGDLLAQGNLEFFISKDYSKDISGTKFANADYILKKIDALRSPIKGLDPTSKKMVLKYFHNLSTLSLAAYK